MAAFVSVTSGSEKHIDNWGRYFYADFFQDEHYGMHYMRLNMGSQKEDLKVWVSTTESTMGIFTSECPTNLNIGPRFNESQSWSLDTVVQSYTTPQSDVFSGTTLTYVRYMGNIVKDTVRVQYNQNQHFEIQTNFLGINNIIGSLSSLYSGFIGLAPYNSVNPAHQSFNFLYQL